MASQSSQSDSLTKNPGVVGSGVRFFQGCKEEFSKITRPTKDETFKATLTTLFIVVFMSIALALMDMLFNAVMEAVL